MCVCMVCVRIRLRITPPVAACRYNRGLPESTKTQSGNYTGMPIWGEISEEAEPVHHG